MKATAALSSASACVPPNDGMPVMRMPFLKIQKSSGVVHRPIVSARLGRLRIEPLTNVHRIFPGSAVAVDTRLVVELEPLASLILGRGRRIGVVRHGAPHSSGEEPGGDGQSAVARGERARETDFASLARISVSLGKADAFTAV